MADARGFRLALEQFIGTEVPEKAAGLQKQVVAELLTGIVLRTPVGNHTVWKNNIARAAKGLPPLPKGYVGGQARRNWQVTMDAPAQASLSGFDQSGDAALSAGYAVAARITRPTNVWISNPLDYMEPLENGWSRQAPQGMVARAVADVTAKYARPVP